MRKLASIQRILSLEPIPNADMIEKATVLGWEVVVKKGDFKVGTLCVYCEIDSILPPKPEFEFLKDRKYCVKTIKLRKQVSQGICFPVDILPAGTLITEGADVTDLIGVTKREEPELKMSEQTAKVIYPEWIPAWLRKIIHSIPLVRKYLGRAYGNKSFPSVIPKTDETRVQVLQPLLDKYKGVTCYITEKLDGSSITVYQINRKFGVCSRNIDLRKDSENRFWKAALHHGLDKKLKAFFGDENIALQGELIGTGIQGNKYSYTGTEIFFFNIFHIDRRSYGSVFELADVCDLLGVKMVPVLDVLYELSSSIPKLVELSRGRSKLNPLIHREGIVIRPIKDIEDTDINGLVRGRVSFKSINPDFLLKYEE